MDEMVLKAQKWVNSTYEMHAGFQKSPENGKTGWGTMYALTMGLQVELGVTELSENFGPTTLGLLDNRYPVIDGSKDIPKNVIKLIQSAMYCKGYDGDDISGVYSVFVSNGIKKLQKEIGLSDNERTGSVTPKLFKALLTMDAYIVIGNGTEKMRSIQQWLNRKYIHRLNFFFMPCDGNFSRDVQKYLVYALQYEIGMDDETANGNFGPGTQEGIKQHQLEVGDMDGENSFVHLFQAAMIFNNQVAIFDGNYTTALGANVRNFQTFAHLTENGKGDFDTWASLLVSTGNPDRKGKALDCVTEITQERGKNLVANGYETVGRYLTNVEGTSLNKKIQPGEIEAIFASGLTLFPIYQTYGGEASYFNEKQGKIDAKAAIEAAKGYGFNQGTTIYFAVDYDAIDTEIQENILPHFYGIYSEMQASGGYYSIGVYGSRNVCSQVSGKGYAALSFVSGMSTGFSGNLGFSLPSNWAFDQISTIEVGSGTSFIEIDNNIKSERDQGQHSVNKPGVNQEFVNELKKINLLALQYVSTGPIFYSANELVCQYYRKFRYTGTIWTMFCGPTDDEWISFADNALKIDQFINPIDPITLEELDIEHLMATLNSLLFFTAEIPALNVKDFCGWAGDLVTVMINVEENKKDYESVYQCALDYIANPLKESMFGRSDLLADFDAINLAKILKTSGKEVAIVVEEYYQNNVYNRFSLALNNRFGGTSEKLLDISKTYLTNIDISNAEIIAAREFFKKAFNVPSYSIEDGEAVCKAFKDIVMKQV